MHLCLLSLLILPSVVAAAQPAGKPAPVISRCDRPFIFGFGSWEKAKTDFVVKADGMHISVKNAQGGAGIAGLNVDATACGDWSPCLTLAVTARNQAQSLNLHLADADGTTHSYRFDLRTLKPGMPQQVVADYGTSLAEPLKVEKAGTVPGLGPIGVWIVIGDWSDKPVDVVLSRIALAPPTAEILAERAKLKEIKAKEAAQARLAAEAKAQARRKLLNAGAPHPADGPAVRHVCAVSADVIAITVQAGQHVSNQLLPYVAEAGDELVEEKDKPVHEVHDGKVVDGFPKGLFRKINQQRVKVGLVSPDGKRVFIQHETKGQLLDETVVDVPAAYSLISADDPNYARPRSPAKVFRKGKPNGFSRPLPFLYTISLQLPAPSTSAWKTSTPAAARPTVRRSRLG